MSRQFTKQPPKYFHYFRETAIITRSLEVYILNIIKLSHMSGHFPATRILVREHDVSENGAVIILILPDEGSRSGFRNFVLLTNKRQWNMSGKRITNISVMTYRHYGYLDLILIHV